MDELGRLLAGGEWRDALARALELWRARPDPELADLVDAIAAHCMSEREAGKRMHGWWIELAADYDPGTVAALATTASFRSGAPIRWETFRARNPGRIAHAMIAANAIPGSPKLWDVAYLDLVERLIAVAVWPRDPRTATILVDWWTAGVVVDTVAAMRVFYGAIAEQLIAIGDVRVVSRLTASLADRAEPTAGWNALRRELVEPVLAALRRPVVSDPRIAAARAIAARAVSDPAQPLWEEVARHPRELGPREVLADFLVARGDPRGELIALQMSGGRRAGERANRLLAEHWTRWLGDLAHVLTRRGTEFRNGMLEVVRVGMDRTPDWAYDRIGGHRELATVQAVRTHCVEAETFARFVDELPHVPELVELDAPAHVDALARHRPAWPIRRLEYRQNSMYYKAADWPALGETATAIARVMPALEEIRLLALPGVMGREVAAAASELLDRLPRLGRLSVTWHAGDPSFAPLAAQPRFEIVPP
jgi:uncharacterized protein (TIGR02996 family)